MKGVNVLLAAAALSLVGTIARADPPDLSGVWLLSGHVGAVKTTDGGAPPLTPEAKAVYEAHRAAAAHGDYSYDSVTPLPATGTAATAADARAL